MRKKKQDTQPEVETPSTSTHKDPISYQGSVEAFVYKGSRRFKTSKRKNNGGDGLFRFLTLCASGQYKDAEQLRPKYVQLFHIDTEGAAAPSETQIKTALDEGSGAVCSSRALFKSTPIPKQATSEPKLWSTTLEFLIPFAQIQKIESEDERANAIALYPNGTASQSEYSAFAVFDSTLLSGATNDYNLFVEWTLTFDNK